MNSVGGQGPVRKAPRPIGGLWFLPAVRPCESPPVGGLSGLAETEGLRSQVLAALRARAARPPARLRAGASEPPAAGPHPSGGPPMRKPAGWRAFWFWRKRRDCARKCSRPFGPALRVRLRACALGRANPLPRVLIHPAVRPCESPPVGGLSGLAETEGFEPSMRLYTAYSLSRGAPSASRSRFQERRLCRNELLNCGPGRFTQPVDRGRTRDAARAPRVPCTSRRSRPRS